MGLWARLRDELANDPLTTLALLAALVALATTPVAFAVLGRLDDFVTRSGYAITPVVVWAGAARELVPNPAEVASIHRIPLTEFMRVDAPLLDMVLERFGRGSAAGLGNRDCAAVHEV